MLHKENIVSSHCFLHTLLVFEGVKYSEALLILHRHTNIRITVCFLLMTPNIPLNIWYHYTEAGIAHQASE